VSRGNGKKLQNIETNQQLLIEIAKESLAADLSMLQFFLDLSMLQFEPNLGTHA